MIKITEVPPEPVKPTYQFSGIDQETAIGLRTLLYNLGEQSRRQVIPGFEQLYAELQRVTGAQQPVLHAEAGSVRIARVSA